MRRWKNCNLKKVKVQEFDAQNRNEAAKAPIREPTSQVGCIGGVSAHLLEALFHKKISNKNIIF